MVCEYTLTFIKKLIKKLCGGLCLKFLIQTDYKTNKDLSNEVCFACFVKYVKIGFIHFLQNIIQIQPTFSDS